MALDLFHFMHKTMMKKGDVTFKIDLDKAYDRVDRDFLKQTLFDFGFPVRCIDLIMSCARSCSLSITWNGAKLDGFVTSRGVIQGYPSSPYVFFLFLEKLAFKIQ